jgi:hypothetical protein
VQTSPLLPLHKLGHAQVSLAQLQHDHGQLNSSSQAMVLSCQHTAAWQLVPQHNLGQQQSLQA